MVVIFFIYRSDSKQQLRDVVEELNYMKDRRTLDKILSENDRYLKVTSFYTEIFATFGQKYHRKYNRKPGEKYEKYIKSGRWKNQGMKKEVRADIVRKCYEYERLCNIPYFDLITTGIRESAGNPLARTFHPKDGSILEAGWFQVRKGAVRDAQDYLKMMPPNMRKKLEFRFNSMQDLFDPLNALKIEACLFWGARIQFHNDPSWYVTAVHWSPGKMLKYWKHGIEPPEKFVFNKNTVREDARNPFTYYYSWNAFNSQFKQFKTQVYIEKGWLEQYEKACSKIEWEFIQYQRYIQRLIKIREKLKEERTQFKELEKKLVNKYNTKLLNLDKKFKELNGLIKRGKFAKIKEIYLIGELEFGKLAKTISSDKVKGKEKRMIKMTLMVIVVVAIFVLFGIVFVVLLIIKGIKYLKRLKDVYYSNDETDVLYTEKNIKEGEGGTGKTKEHS
jgi:hypothetical protein